MLCTVYDFDVQQVLFCTKTLLFVLFQIIFCGLAACHVNFNCLSLIVNTPLRKPLHPSVSLHFVVKQTNQDIHILWILFFKQFEKDVVDICFEVLDNSPAALKNSEMDIANRGSPVYVSRTITAMVRHLSTWPFIFSTPVIIIMFAQALMIFSLKSSVKSVLHCIYIFYVYIHST